MKLSFHQYRTTGQKRRTLAAYNQALAINDSQELYALAVTLTKMHKNTSTAAKEFMTSLSTPLTPSGTKWSLSGVCIALQAIKDSVPAK